MQTDVTHLLTFDSSLFGNSSNPTNTIFFALSLNWVGSLDPKINNTFLIYCRITCRFRPNTLTLFPGEVLCTKVILQQYLDSISYPLP